MFHEEEMGKLLAKNIARKARIKLDGRHPLLGEYLQDSKTLYFLNLLINMQLKINSTSMKVNMFWLVFKLGIILNE